MSDERYSGLFKAVSGGKVKSVVVQLSSCKNLPEALSAQDARGFTALHLAAKRGHTAVVELLLDRGANLALPSADGQSVLGVAINGKAKRATILMLINAISAKIVAERLKNRTARQQETGDDFYDEEEEEELADDEAFLQSLGYYGDVTVLELGGCGLNEVPAAIFACLHSLRKLDVSKNTLVRISPQIRHLKELKELNLANNLIEYLPSELAFLPHLKKVKIVGNPLTGIPKSVRWEFISGGTKALLSYLRSLRRETAWKHIKLMFLGQEGVGKTSLVRCFTKSRGPEDHLGDTVSTNGIDVEEWELDSSVTFSVWDFGGQEVFYPTHQFFLTNRSIYILVFNMSKDITESRLEYWLKKIKTMLSQNTKVYLVGTHGDHPRCTEEHINQTIATMMKKYPKYRYPQIEDILIVSCRTRKGISELKKVLRAAARQHPLLSMKVPKSYLKLQEMIVQRRMKENYISLENFQEAAAKLAIPKGREVRALEFFHDVGLICHFNDDTNELRNLVVINPQWLANVMSSVITFTHNFVRNGVLDHSHLPTIWKGYDEKMHATLLRLLQKFEVAYPYPDKEGHPRSIVPCLLPDAKPWNAIKEVWPAKIPSGFQQCGREYQFEFVPLGFFSRLIMRIICVPDIELVADASWRDGCVARLGVQYAMMELNPVTYLLKISVRMRDQSGLEMPQSQGRGGSARSATDESTSKSRLLIRIVIALIEDLLQYYYPTLIESTRRSVPCSHCIEESSVLVDPYMFSFEECVRRVQKGVPFVFCCGIPDRPVSISALAPDVTFSELPTIPESELEITKMIGEGGFGKVYLGLISDKKIPVAVKELHIDPPDEFGSKSEELEKFQEFQREVYIMSCLSHENLVRLYGIMLRPSLRMIMEFIADGDLYHLLRKKTFDDPQLSLPIRLKIAYDVACGMTYLHGVNPPIVHCDLRSPNVFLEFGQNDAGGVTVRAKVADFGLSRPVFVGATGFLNTWQWLPPEVIDLNSKGFTEMADVYSFAIIMWELLTGAFPFEEFDEFKEEMVDRDGEVHHVLKLQAIKKAIIRKNLRPTIPSGTTPALSKLIQDCWSSSPDARPSFLQIRQCLKPIVSASGCSLFSLSHKKRVDADAILSMTNVGALVEQAGTHEHVIEPFSVLDNKQPVFCLLYLEKLSQLWCGCRDGTISVWDVNTWTKSSDMPLHEKRIYDMILVNDHVWTASDDGQIVVLDPTQIGRRAEVHKFTVGTGRMVKSLCWVVPDYLGGIQDTVWCCCPADSSIFIFNSETYSLMASFPLEPTPLCLHQEGGCVWVGTIGDMFIFDAERQSLLFTIPGAHLGRINALASSNHGQVWSCSDDRTVRVWDADRYLLVRTLRGASSKVLSLGMVDKHVWAGGFDTSIIVFDATSHLPVAELKGQHKDSVTASAWITGSPEARTLVSSGRDGLISVWRYAEGVELDPVPKPREVRHASSTTATSADDALSSEGSVSPRTGRRGRFFRHPSSRSPTRSGSRSPRRGSSKSALEQSQSRSYSSLTASSSSSSTSSKRDSLAIPSSKSSRFPWRSRHKSRSRSKTLEECGEASTINVSKSATVLASVSGEIPVTPTTSISSADNYSAIMASAPSFPSSSKSKSKSSSSSSSSSQSKS